MQLGLIALARQDLPTASRWLNAAIPEEKTPPLTPMNPHPDPGFAVSSAAGEQDLADSAWKPPSGNPRARLNGVDDADIYYTRPRLYASAMMCLPPGKAQQSYNRGFRELWLLSLDWRLDNLRDQASFIDLKSRSTRTLPRRLPKFAP